MKNLIYVVLLLTAIVFASGCCGEAKPKNAIDRMKAKVTMNKTVGKTEFMVGGACGMCEDRIENTVKKIQGVNSVDYDLEKQMVYIDFDEKIVKLEDIKKAIAAKGHDTEDFKADDKVYDALPGCCKYRVEETPEKK
ncbi:MAG: heavy-metal-associated domain-containing protein [Candidatus Delongbacteria bacterium]|jgi:mercuric ion binding protein|nr:heavy-metal-associated domain-containing protein [Candidatus Delongbacteria bacterium]